MTKIKDLCENRKGRWCKNWKPSALLDIIVSAFNTWAFEQIKDKPHFRWLQQTSVGNAEWKWRDNTPFSHRENSSGQKDRNIAATCVSLFTRASLLTKGISWFKQQNKLNY